MLAALGQAVTQQLNQCGGRGSSMYSLGQYDKCYTEPMEGESISLVGVSVAMTTTHLYV